jgi:uncharacterized protein YacL
MAKILGYILALLGLVGIALSNKIASLSFIAALGTKAKVYPVVGSIILIIIGLVLVTTKSSEFSNVQQSKEEVPIYEGEGKNRKIVGYKKAK